MGPAVKILIENKKAAESRKTSTRIHNDAVKARLSGIKDQDFERKSPFLDRQKQQVEKLQLPEFPTTTIGSFPQTKEVRQARSQWKKGELSDADYDTFLKKETEKCVSFQDEIGIVCLFMVSLSEMIWKYFGESLEGVHSK